MWQQGIYAITQPSHHLLQQVEIILQQGIAMLQYRDKSQSYAQRLSQALQLKQLCQSYQVPLIINDDVVLAQAVKAEGVHIGKEDDALADARKILGHDAIIGVSCYNSLARAIQAEQQGADYVAFGRFFVSKTKPEAQPADQQLLHAAKQQLTLPIVAIGGITPDNGAQLLAAGADLLAVIAGIFDQPDVEQAMIAYNKLFNAD